MKILPSLFGVSGDHTNRLDFHIHSAVIKYLCLSLTQWFQRKRSEELGLSQLPSGTWNATLYNIERQRLIKQMKIMAYVYAIYKKLTSSITIQVG